MDADNCNKGTELVRPRIEQDAEGTRASGDRTVQTAWAVLEHCVLIMRDKRALPLMKFMA